MRVRHHEDIGTYTCKVLSEFSLFYLLVNNFIRIKLKYKIVHSNLIDVINNYVNITMI